MRGLGTLVAMQLRDKLDLAHWKSAKSIIFKVVLTIIKYALIVGVIYFGFTLLSGLRLLSLLPGIPQSVMNVLFTVMLLLSILVATVAITNNMYFTKDNALLLTLPAGRTTVFTSKLIVFYVYELIRNSTYMLPVLVAYGLINGITIMYYFWLVPAFLLITAVPVVIGALLSIPFMLVTRFVKQHRILQALIMLGAIVGGIYLVVVLISIIPTSLNLVGTWGTTFWEIQAWLTNFSYNFVLFAFLLEGIIGYRYGVAITLFTETQILAILCMIAGVVVVLGITYLLVRPLFFHMASTPFEYKKVTIRRKYNNKCRPKIMSAMVKNLKLTVRSSEQISYLAYVAIGMPIAILLLNKIFDAIDMSAKGTNMAIVINVLIILLLAMSTNLDMSYVFSSEGSSAYINKTIPGSYVAILFTKLIVNYVITTISIIVTTIIVVSARAVDTAYAWQIWGTLQCMYTAHMLISAELDIMNPQTQQYATTGGHVSNPNETRSGIIAYLLAVAVAGWSYFLIDERPNLAWKKMLAIAACFMIFRMWTFITKTKLYYKEK